jgi:hypothetical protein
LELETRAFQDSTGMSDMPDYRFIQ